MSRGWSGRALALCSSGLALGLGVAVALLPARAAARACPPPPVIVDLDMERPYSDAAGTEADEALKARHAAEAEPLKQVLSTIVKGADAAMAAGHPAGASVVTCGRNALVAWARGGALLGTMKSKQAEYERKWNMTGLALAYLKIKLTLAAEDRAVIEPWLKRLADASHAFAAMPGHKRNNHWYWLGLGLGAVALGTGDAAYWDKAHAIYRDALSDIADDGTLRLELARGKRALHYHDFALMPLVTLAELAAAKGEDWWRERDGALQRLVQLTLAGFSRPQEFAARAGAAQELPKRPATGWGYLYRRRFPEKTPPAADMPLTHSSHRWLGGDVRHLARAVADLPR